MFKQILNSDKNNFSIIYTLEYEKMTDLRKIDWSEGPLVDGVSILIINFSETDTDTEDEKEENPLSEDNKKIKSPLQLRRYRQPLIDFRIKTKSLIVDKTIFDSKEDRIEKADAGTQTNKKEMEQLVFKVANRVKTNIGRLGTIG